jgi:hypothetical protein
MQGQGQVMHDAPANGNQVDVLQRCVVHVGKKKKQANVRK